MMQSDLIHSPQCKRNDAKNRLTRATGVCDACDKLRRFEDDARKWLSDANDDSDRQIDKLYCKNAYTVFERCTKATYPSCACGKLVYYQDRSLFNN